MKMCRVQWCICQAPCPQHKTVPFDERCPHCNGSATSIVAGAPVPCEGCHGSGRIKKKAVPRKRRTPVDERDLMTKMLR